MQTSDGTALTHNDYSRLLLAFSAALFGIEAAPGKASTMSLRKFAGRRLNSRA